MVPIYPVAEALYLKTIVRNQFECHVGKVITKLDKRMNWTQAQGIKQDENSETAGHKVKQSINNTNIRTTVLEPFKHCGLLEGRGVGVGGGGGGVGIILVVQAPNSTILFEIHRTVKFSYRLPNSISVWWQKT